MHYPGARGTARAIMQVVVRVQLARLHYHPTCVAVRAVPRAPRWCNWITCRSLRLRWPVAQFLAPLGVQLNVLQKARARAGG